MSGSWPRDLLFFSSLPLSLSLSLSLSCFSPEVNQKMRLNLSLNEQLAFYGAYHANRMNQVRPEKFKATPTRSSHALPCDASTLQLIHFVFVPIILFSVAVWLAYTPAFLLTLPVLAGQPHEVALNGGFFLILVPYSLFYILLDPFAGTSWSACVGLPVWLGANALRQAHPADAWLWAIYAHVFGWFMQIVPGHTYFERRKPSLMDSFVQSLLLAPLFVWFELLFALGYRPGLHAEVSASAREIIASARGAGRRLLDQDDGDEID